MKYPKTKQAPHCTFRRGLLSCLSSVTGHLSSGNSKGNGLDCQPESVGQTGQKRCLSWCICALSGAATRSASTPRPAASMAATRSPASAPAAPAPAAPGGLVLIKADQASLDVPPAAASPAAPSLTPATVAAPAAVPPPATARVKGHFTLSTNPAKHADCTQHVFKRSPEPQ